MVDHLLKQSKVDHSIGVAYFYFDYQIRVSPRDIIASLLKQLCYQKDKIPDSIMQLWELREAPEPHSSQETLKSDRVPEFGELLAAFSNLASKFRRTYVCLDALDECPEEHQHALQELLHRLRLARCSLLITSRPELKYEEYFKHDPQISIEATSEDIGYYVASILDQHPELRDMVDSGLQRKISTVLAEKSNGMCVYVYANPSFSFGNNIVAGFFSLHFRCSKYLSRLQLGKLKKHFNRCRKHCTMSTHLC